MSGKRSNRPPSHPGLADGARGEEWKAGVCTRLGWGTPQDGWRRVLSKVTDFRDLEVDLLRSVEELIDFVTAADGDG